MDELDNLIEIYVSAAIIHGEESWGGDTKKANRQYQILTKCFLDICRYGEAGESALKRLLTHTSHFVRCSAAFHILPFDSKAGLKTLKECRKKPNGVGFNAKITLSEWRNGELKFPIQKEGKVIYVSPDEIREIFVKK